MSIKLAAVGAGTALVVAAIVVLYLAFVPGDGSGTAASALHPAPTATAAVPSPTALPATWPGGLKPPEQGTTQLLSCLDTNHDGSLSAADGPEFQGFETPLDPGNACGDPANHADFYAGPASGAAYACGGAHEPLLIVAIASAGSDLLQPSEGESMGVLDIVNALRARTAAAGIGTATILAAPAIFGVAGDELPQTHMAQFLRQQVRQRLAAMPCLRAVVVGHSHGGVTVTSVTYGLDATYADRMFGVIIDRTDALYDRHATELPARAKVLNAFQTNEGWHGVAIDQPNFTNIDASREMAPIAPSDGGGQPALVTHKTLDDSPAVQLRIADAVMAWASAP